MKLGQIIDGEEVPAFTRDAYELQEFEDGTTCVLARCTSDPIGLLVHLLEKSDGPVALLYVLLLSRTGKHEPGRYQSPFVSITEAVAFLHRFGEFLSSDGRHSLWIHDPKKFTVVYDNHERTWIYGPVEDVVPWMEEKGLRNWPLEPIPVPHMHYYHDHYDHEEDAILETWDWNRLPLKENDRS